MSTLQTQAKATFPDLSPGEATVCAAAERGTIAELGPERLHDDRTLQNLIANKNDPAIWPPGRTVRAEFLAWLLTDRGATALVHHRGVWIQGALVKGKLDLDGARIGFRLGLWACVIPEELGLMDARATTIALAGSRTGPIRADRLRTTGGLFLCDGFKAEGEVRLLGARIGGDLNCSDGTFTNPGADALSADGATVRGGVFLSGGFKAEGLVRLPSARIGGDLACVGGSFVKEAGDRVALVLGRARVAGTLQLFGGCSIRGHASLDHLTVGQLNDAPFDTGDGRSAPVWERMPEWAQLDLRGFRCTSYAGDSSTKATERLTWLRRQVPAWFSPEPYRHCAEVLRRMGHDEDATRVLIGMNDQRRAVARLPDTRHPLTRRERLWLWLIKHVMDYGYAPFKALRPLVVLWVISSLVFYAASLGKVMVPADAQVLVDEAYVASRQAPADYPAFAAAVFAFETMVPFIDYHQERYWIPDAGRALELGWIPLMSGSWAWGGWAARCWLWTHITLGWTLSSLAVAGFTGLVRER